jgi:hypothetical protein
MKRSNKSSLVLTMAATLALSFATLATAQSDALGELYVSASNVPTNIAGVHTYATPREGFNPLTATDVELANLPPTASRHGPTNRGCRPPCPLGEATVRIAFPALRGRLGLPEPSRQARRA